VQIVLSSLKKLLAEFGISTKSWGKGKAKTLADLLEEIRKGESQLVVGKNGIVRVVSIVKLHVYDPNYPGRGYLVESRQQLPDGRVRRRRRQPSEKIKGGEPAKSAAVRGLREELRMRGGYVLFRGTLRTENTPNPSYPRLPCRYIIHKFNVALEFRSTTLQEEFRITEEDGTVHFFRWKRPKRADIILPL